MPMTVICMFSHAFACILSCSFLVAVRGELEKLSLLKIHNTESTYGLQLIKFCLIGEGLTYFCNFLACLYFWCGEHWKYRQIWLLRKSHDSRPKHFLKKLLAQSNKESTIVVCTFIALQSLFEDLFLKELL